MIEEFANMLEKMMQESISGYSFDRTKDEARELIEKAKNTDLISDQWVSVEDRLPEGEGRCIIMWCTGSVSDVPKSYVRQCKGNIAILWLDAPLPQPPKEELVEEDVSEELREEDEPCLYCLKQECECSDFDIDPDMGARG